MLVYQLCVPPTTAAAPRPTARSGTSKRRVNHRSTDRNRAQRRVTTVAVTNAHVPAPRSPTPTLTSASGARTCPIPLAPAAPTPASAPSLTGAVEHASLHVLHSLLFEFLSVSIYIPAPYSVATATARIRDSWGAFTIFASRMLGPTAMALPDERRLGQRTSALHIHEPADVPPPA